MLMWISLTTRPPTPWKGLSARRLACRRGVSRSNLSAVRAAGLVPPATTCYDIDNAPLSLGCIFQLSPSLGARQATWSLSWECSCIHQSPLSSRSGSRPWSPGATFHLCCAPPPFPFSRTSTAQAVPSPAPPMLSLPRPPATRAATLA